jgi:hypothetical protein
MMSGNGFTSNLISKGDQGDFFAYFMQVGDSDVWLDNLNVSNLFGFAFETTPVITTIVPTSLSPTIQQQTLLGNPTVDTYADRNAGMIQLIRFNTVVASYSGDSSLPMLGQYVFLAHINSTDSDQLVLAASSSASNDTVYINLFKLIQTFTSNSLYLWKP